MPKEILLLHYSPDAEVVGRLTQRLEAAGITVKSHERSLEAGATSDEVIRQWIRDADLVLFCASDRAADPSRSKQDWFQAELAWCQALLDGKRSFFPIRVGPFDPAELRLPGAAQANFWDLLHDLGTDASFECRVAQLIDQIVGRLGLAPRMPVTAIAVAMTAAECEELQDSPAYEAQRRKLLGMFHGVSEAEVWQLLSERYGSTREALRPFANSSRNLCIPEEISRLQAGINAQRNVRKERPIHVTWVGAELEAARPPLGDAARDDWDRIRNEWHKGDSLVVIDGISLLHDTPRKLVGELPDMNRPNQGSWIWLWPWTTDWAARLGQIDDLVAGVQDVQRKFDQWRKLEHLARGEMVGFDVSLPHTLECWLFHALLRAQGDLHEHEFASSEKREKLTAAQQTPTEAPPMIQGGGFP